MAKFVIDVETSLRLRSNRRRLRRGRRGGSSSTNRRWPIGHRDVHRRATDRRPVWTSRLSARRTWRRGLVGLVIRLEHQDHALAFHLVVALDLRALPQLGLDLGEDVAPEVNVGELAAAELQCELHLVAFLEELAGVIDLD